MNETLNSIKKFDAVKADNLDIFFAKFKNPKILEELVNLVKSHYDDSPEEKEAENRELAKLAENIAEFLNISLLSALYSSFKSNPDLSVEDDLPQFISQLTSPEVTDPVGMIDNLLSSASDIFWIWTEAHLKDFLIPLKALKL
ncbi:hypothetical protein KJ628_05665 [Patescibacteria group bacterium]|nr:hypothetical protein [Patescibacteria group bacterium]